MINLAYFRMKFSSLKTNRDLFESDAHRLGLLLLSGPPPFLRKLPPMPVDPGPPAEVARRAGRRWPAPPTDDRPVVGPYPAARPPPVSTSSHASSSSSFPTPDRVRGILTGTRDTEILNISTGNLNRRFGANRWTKSIRYARRLSSVRCRHQSVSQSDRRRQTQSSFKSQRTHAHPEHHARADTAADCHCKVDTEIRSETRFVYWHALAIQTTWTAQSGVLQNRCCNGADSLTNIWQPRRRRNAAANSTRRVD